MNQILMKKILLILISIFTFSVVISCSNFNMPDKDDSKISIMNSNSDLQRIDKAINENIEKNNSLKTRSEMSVRMVDKFLNSISKQISTQREDDIKFFILPKKSFFTETKKVLGLEYNNFVNIDTGFIALNLKKLEFNKLTNNKIYGVIEIEGKGNLKLSGKHTGVPGSFSPDISLYLKEDITFSLKAENNYLILTPDPQEIELKTKFTVSFLDFKIPYSQSFQLKLKDLVKPVRMPLAFQNYVALPKPEEKINSKKMIYEKYQLNFDDINIKTVSGILEYGANVSLEKK